VGDLTLNAAVAAGRSAAFVAGRSIVQSGSSATIDALRASFDAKTGSVGLAADFVDVRVGLVAAKAPAGGVFLRQATGNLSIGTVEAVSGLPSISGIAAGGAVIVSATSGTLTVAGPVSGASVALTASGSLIQSAGITAATSVVLTASAGADLGGPVSGGSITVTAGQNLVVRSGIASLTDASFAAQTVNFMDGSSLTANSTTITATSALEIAGDLTVTGHAALVGVTVVIAPSSSFVAGTAAVTSATSLSINGTAVVAGAADLSGRSVTVGPAGSVTAGVLHLTATAGSVVFNGNATAAGLARIEARGDAGSMILQGTGSVVSAGAAVLKAAGSVGAVSAPIQLNVVQIAVDSGGVVVLNQAAGVGGLVVGTVDGVSGISAQGAVTVTSSPGAFSQMVVPLPIGGFATGPIAIAVVAAIDAPGPVTMHAAQGVIVIAGPTTATLGNAINIRTEQGDIVLAHRIAGQSIMISAGQPTGSAPATVLFAGGYLVTPEGRVVRGLAPPIPTVIPVRLNASLSVSFLVHAGHIAQTVDGLLSDVGLKIDVDFVQPADPRFVSINPRNQTANDPT
jgi:hypothetical protein